MPRPSRLVLSLALLASAAAGLPSVEMAVSRGADAAGEDADAGAGYLDLRLYGMSLPVENKSESLGKDYDSSYRVSLMAIGPVCGIVPVNCFTPAKPSPEKTGPEEISWASRDGWNFLGGMEASFSRWDLHANPLYSVDEAVVSAIAVTFHVFQLGFQVPCRCNGRFQYEIGPFFSLGQSSVSWGDPTGIYSDSMRGLYYEFGARGAMIYTFNFGLQVGAEVRYTASYNKAKSAIFSTLYDLDFDTRGVHGGGFLGWRF